MTEAALTTDALTSRLADTWGIHADTVTTLDGGMNSQTWLITSAGERWVAKAVPTASQPHLTGGLAVASLVEAGGIPAGAPKATLDGRLAVEIDGRTLALLKFVPGVELTRHTAQEQELLGTTLGQVHRILSGATIADAQTFHWMDLGAEHLDVRAWVRPAIAAALEAWQALAPDRFASGLLHSDPAPEHFRHDVATGRCGLIDWDRALVGPLLYDVASAVMYAGGPDRATALLAAYAAEGVLSTSEIEIGLRPALRVRWAIQAYYFAQRVAANDLTGVDDARENEEGLEDARRALHAGDS